MDKKRIGSIVIAISLVVLVIVLLIIERIKYQSNLKTQNIFLTSDYSIFFALDESANKYVSYISNKNNNGLMILLDQKYKEENNINSSNVISKLDKYDFSDKIVSFKTEKIYEELLSNNITKYYLSGKIYEEDSEDIREYTNYYLIITLNSENYTYSITPYDGDIFKEKNL